MGLASRLFFLFLLIIFLAGISIAVYEIFYKPKTTPVNPQKCANFTDVTCVFDSQCMFQACSDASITETRCNPDARCFKNPIQPVAQCVNFTDLTCNFNNQCMFQLCTDDGVTTRCVPDGMCSQNPNPNPSPAPSPIPAPVWSVYKCMTSSNFTDSEKALCSGKACVGTNDCVLKVNSLDNTQRVCTDPTYISDGCDFSQNTSQSTSGDVCSNLYRMYDDCGNLKTVANRDCNCSQAWPYDNPTPLMNIGKRSSSGAVPYVCISITNGKMVVSDPAKTQFSFVVHDSNGRIYIPIDMNNAYYVKKDLTLSKTETDGAVWYHNSSSGLIVDDPVNPASLWSIDDSGAVILRMYARGADNINLDPKTVWRYHT